MSSSSFLEQIPAECPGTYGEDFACSTPDRLKPDFHSVPVWFSLTSCICSMLGSMLMILPYVLWKDVRTGLRTIVTYLAVADFFTAFGYTIASFNYLQYKSAKETDYPKACSVFSSVCQLQAYISSWASLSSFWWTAILAYYLYSTITKGNARALDKFFPYFHVFVWGSPILIMLPLLLTNSLGYSLFSAGGWCFISSDKRIEGTSQFTGYSLSSLTILKIFIGGKAVEIGTYAWVFALFGMIYCNLKKKKDLAIASNEQSEGFVNLLRQMERKLYFIPIAFIVVRIWGTLQFFTSIGVFAKDNAVDSTGCVSHRVYYLFYFFACIQSVGDGAQGWVNAVLYILLSPKIRLRLLGLILNPLCGCLYDTLGLFHQSDAGSVKPIAPTSTIQYKSNTPEPSSQII